MISILAAKNTACPSGNGMNSESLVFLPEAHSYLYDGVRVPCVSDLCRFVSREIYQDTPQWKMDAAAARGTAVHAAAEKLDRTGEAEIDDVYLPYLEAYAAFRREQSVSWEFIEQSFFHPAFRYAGTIDRYGILDGKKTLVDLKTTYAVHRPVCAASLNLYRLLLESNGYPVERMLLLHLQKTRKYRLIPFEIDNDIPYALLILQKLTYKRKRGKRNG